MDEDEWENGPDPDTENFCLPYRLNQYIKKQQSLGYGLGLVPEPETIGTRSFSNSVDIYLLASQKDL